jgi:hypothetical protein
MSLLVPKYVSPFHTRPIQGYAEVGTIAINFRNKMGSIGVFVSPDVDASTAGLTPLDSFGISLGAVIAPGVNCPTLDALIAQAAAAARGATPYLDPFSAIRAAVYAVMQQHERLSGATLVP